MSVTCPRCKNNFEELIKIDPGMKLRLQEVGNDSHSLSEACVNCFSELKADITQGAKLIAEENQKEQQRKLLWKNRVGYIKEARERMNVRAFSDAALLYEKYLRALEIVHKIPAGKLDPIIFTEPGKTKELTLLVTVYWDLFRIYDTSDRYADRQKSVADKLLSILPVCTVQSDLLKKAERFVREAKQESKAREFLRDARIACGASRCFIATASFDSPRSPEVLILRQFRDQFLKQNKFGRSFIYHYYKQSPKLVPLILKYKVLKLTARAIIKPIASLLALSFNLQSK